MNKIWLNWLFQNRINEDEGETYFDQEGIDFDVPFTLFDVTPFPPDSSLKSEELEVLVYYYPDTDELKVDLWSNKTGTSLSEELEEQRSPIPCSYKAFFSQLEFLASKAARCWGQK
jgi:hypothetical protein